MRSSIPGRLRARRRATLAARAVLPALCALCALGPRGVAGQDAPGSPLSLEEAVETALARSPEIRRARALADQVGAAEWETWGSLVPSLYLSLGLNESSVLQRTATDPVTGGIVTLPDSLIDVRESFGTSAALTASWTVFDGGRRFWAIREARSLGRAADLRVAAARARMEADITVAFLDALETASQRGVREAELERARSLAEAARARMDAGEAPELDVLQAQLAATDAELALLEAEDEAEAARLALFQYLGVDAGADVELVVPASLWASAPVPGPAFEACVLERSAELDALRAEVDAAEEQASSQRWSSLLPRVELAGRWVRSEFGQTRQALTTSPRNEQTYYQLQFSWSPLDAPGRWFATRQRARAELAAAEAALAVRRPAIARDVEVALGRLRRSRALEDRARLSTDLAERQLEQATERYRLGVGSITETLQAESMAREAERQRLAARFAGLRALAELQAAAGVSLFDGPARACAGS